MFFKVFLLKERASGLSSFALPDPYSLDWTGGFPLLALPHGYGQAILALPSLSLSWPFPARNAMESLQLAPPFKKSQEIFTASGKEQYSTICHLPSLGPIHMDLEVA